MVLPDGSRRVSATVLRATERLLLTFVSVVYNSDSACVAVKLTVPNPTTVMTPLLSIVATAPLLDPYVTVPLLKLVGMVVIANDASPYVLLCATANVEAENPDAPLVTVITTLPLESVKFALAA